MKPVKVNIWKAEDGDWECNVSDWNPCLPYSLQGGKISKWTNPMNFVAMVLRYAEEYNTYEHDTAEHVMIKFGTFKDTFERNGYGTR